MWEIYLDGDQHQIYLEANDSIYDQDYLLRFAEAIKDTAFSMMEHPNGKLRDIDMR